MAFTSGRRETAENTVPATLFVNKSRCPQNHPCPAVRVCPAGALSQTGVTAPAVDQEKCIRCGKCVKYCPKKVLTLQ